MQSGDPVKFEILETFLPGDDFVTKNGWQKRDLTGMALTVPIRGSQASLTLRKDGVETGDPAKCDTFRAPALG